MRRVCLLLLLARGKDVLLMKTRLTAARLKHHFAYSLWKYILLVVLAVFGWNLIYTTTAYRPPAEKKVDLYLCTGIGDQVALDAYLENVRQQEMSDMEEMSSVILGAGGSDPYVVMQLTTYIMAGEGDVYLLSRDDFFNYASQGALLELESYVDEGALRTGEMDLSHGWRVCTDTGERHLYGIPAASFTGLEQFGLPKLKDMYFCVTVNCGNNPNAVKLLDILARDFIPAQP